MFLEADAFELGEGAEEFDPFGVRRGKALQSEIELPGLFRHQEPAQLNDELEPLRTGDWIPADDRIAILEVPGRSAFEIREGST